jgi:HlyD family secretion protein
LKGKALLGVVVLGLIGGAAWWLSRRAAPPPTVSGTIETDQVHVASRYGGRVVKLHAQEGDPLRAGQLIVELDATELTARRDYAAAVLAELEAGPRSNEVVAARYAWEALAAQVIPARADAERARQLFVEKAISESEWQNAVSRAAALERSAEAARSQYELLVEGTRPERLAQARAQLAEIEAQLREMRITAPSWVGREAGESRGAEAAPTFILEVLNVKVGDVLPANREVATLLMPGHLWARVFVPETWLGFIQVGQAVAVRNDSTSQVLTGVVEQINRQAEFTPRNVQTVADRVRQVYGVKVRLPTETGVLRAGMSVDVEFPNVPPPPR